MNRSRAAAIGAFTLAVLACETRSHAPKSTLDAGDDGSQANEIVDSAPVSPAPDSGYDSSMQTEPEKDAGADMPGADMPGADVPSSDVGPKPAVCGNGVIESGEQCDPPGTCPATCPNQGCTKFMLQGSAAACTATCVVAGMQTACAHDDGCCPAGCDSTNDRDCAIKCGNGVKEGMETCDPLSSCPTSCPPMGCQIRKLVNANTCTAACVNDHQETSCVSGDGCCPSSCNHNNDSDCPAKCGNGVVESGETCDPVSTCNSMQSQCTSDKDKIRSPSGDASKCTFTCSETNRVCGASDGFCPTGCTSGDPDCKKATGQSCGGNSECVTGFCADGYCCNQGCTMGCYSCAGSATGKPNGTCSPVTNNEMCSPRTCSNGDVVEGHCSGGNCQPQVVKACSSTETCMNAMCVATCGNDGLACCVGGTLCSSTNLYCDDSFVCRVRRIDGSECTDATFNRRDDWCKSNYCGRSGICIQCGAQGQNCCTSGATACKSGLFCGNGCPNNVLKPDDKDSTCETTPADPSFCQ
jgi:hypothetical protein